MRLFPELVHKFKYDGLYPEDTIPICQQFIDNAPSFQIPLEVGPHAKSSRFTKQTPHEHPHFKSYFDWLLPNAKKVMIEEWEFDPDIQYVIGETWVNNHYRGDMTLQHHHAFAAAAVSHYISAPPHCGRILFEDPCEQFFRGYPHKQDYAHGWCPVEIETGDTLIFPGWLPHCVEESQTDEPRWVLTTNIICFQMYKK